MTRHITVILCLLLCLGGVARAEVYVAVAPFEAHGRDAKDPNAALMQELVAVCLSTIPAIAVVERTELNALTQEKSLVLSGGYRGNRAPFRVRGARYIITGSLAPVKDQWLLTLQVNDPATTRIVAAHSAMLGLRYYESEGKLCDRGVTPLVQALLRIEGKSNNYSAPEDDDSPKSTLLLQGIGYERSGDHAHAFPFFLKILEHDPQNADATCWLAISYAGAGMHAFARTEASKCLAEAPNHPKREDIEALLAEKTK